VLPPGGLRAAPPAFLVKNINLSFGSSLQGLTDVHGLLYFSANDGVNGTKLWRSDGTEAGTQPANLGPQVIDPQQPAPFGQGLLVVGSGSSSGQALFFNDGTSASSTLLKDNFQLLGALGTLGGAWYFLAGTADTELWRTDGTPAGTLKVKTLVTGSVVLVAPGAVQQNGAYYFILGVSLWKSDGTEQGTLLLKQFALGIGHLTVFGALVAFSANDGASGTEVWKSDGTPDGTQLVKDISVGSSLANGPSPFAIAGGRIVFVVAAASPPTLWSSDGSEAGTTQIATLSGSTSEIVGNGRLAFFANQTPEAGLELWASDGSAAGTRQVLDQIAGSAGAMPYRLTIVDGALVYVASGPAGTEPWRSDGSATGTAIVADVLDGSDGSNPNNFVASGEYVFFSAADASNDRELYAVPRASIAMPTIYLPLVAAP
jgi:ELWxxDGT repeat protein